MKFPESWLREFVDPAVSREELCARLTMAGLEVEGVTALGAGLDNVVVAKIVECVPHPKADKLRVCSVDAGAGERLQIVCGAPNARVGLNAPLAKIGAKLPNGMAIKAAKLRDVESFGMLCSAKELELADDSSGLWELPGDAPVGAPLAEYLGLPDATIELKLTPNRPDCLGLRGLASEVATLFDVKNYGNAIAAVAPSSSRSREVRLEAPADCPRYAGRVIEGVDAKARTPLWMVERLRRSGLRSISAVVDCTNYVMLELGQPMHAFDDDKLDGAIVVRRARAAESLKLLDGRDVTVDPEFLLIADRKNPLALAGVMGGFDSRVTDDTKNLFLEAAHFAPPVIVGRARKLGMHTDASHRFERGVDPELPRLAIERLTQLLVSIVGGKPGAVVESVEPSKLPQRKPVRLREARVRRVLGIPLAAERIETILRGLDMTLTRNAEGWDVAAPSRRFDIEIEEDLIEELARIHGYEKIPTHPPTGEIALVMPSETRVADGELRRILIARGYAEAVNFSFVAPELLRAWSLDADAVALANPLSAELSQMRTSLLPGLVNALSRNLARQHARVRLFELGNVFERREGAPRETGRIAGAACGRAAAEQWSADRRALDFFDLKGEVEQMLAATGAAAEFKFVPESGAAFLHPGRSAAIVRGGAKVGVLGCLHPRLAKALDLALDTWVFELDLEPLTSRRVPRAGELSRFPQVRRDIAVVIDRSISFDRVEAAIRDVLGVRLKDFVLFDEFTGQGLPAGARSLAMGLILQDDSRTLTDEDAERDVAAVVAVLAQEFKASLRT